MHIRVVWIAFFVFVSLAGLLFHNSDLPNLTPLSPENSVPSIISIALFILWWMKKNQQSARILLLIWAILNLIGGLLSAIPFDFWNFGQLQTTDHLIKHTIYALAQLPLIIALIKLK